jgi:hypothetical protein
MHKHFKLQFVKGLESLKAEINSFSNEKMMWETKVGVSNSAGNLALHLIGNLNHFIGAQFGKTGFIREREKEFSDKSISREVMLSNINETILVVEESFNKLPESALKKVFPLNTFGENKTVEEVLLILLAHFNYHLGQINYFRRQLQP